MAEFLEAVMLVCFGLSWPMNAYKAAKARTAAGTSWQFILLITLGYVAGIAAKFVSGQINWVLAVYFLNMIAIAANWIVYFRNVKPMLLRRAAIRKNTMRDARRCVRKASMSCLKMAAKIRKPRNMAPRWRASKPKRPRNSRSDRAEWRGVRAAAA